MYYQKVSRTLIILTAVLIAVVPLFAQWHTETRISNTPKRSMTNLYSGGWNVGADGSDVGIVWLDRKTETNGEIRYVGFPIGNLPEADSRELISSDGINPVVATNGPNHVDWHQTNYLHFREKTDGWSEIIDHGRSNCEQSTIADDKEGNTHCVFTQGGWVWYQRRNSGSGSFSNLSGVHHDWSSRLPTLCIDQNNIIHVSWVNSYERSIGYAYSTDNGSSWKVTQLPSTHPRGYQAITMCCKDDGDVYIAYSCWQRPCQIHVIAKENGTWGGPINVSNSSSYCNHPSLCCDTFGNVWAAWTETYYTNGSVAEIWFNRLDAGTGNWDGSQQLTSDDGKESGCPNITADSKGNVHVVWDDTRDGNHEIYYNWYLSPGSPGTLSWKYETGDQIRSSPAIAPDGTVYVGSFDHYLYALNPDGTLKWRYLTGDWIASSPAIVPDGTVYVGSGDNYLYALNPDGSLKWRYEAGDRVISSPAIGSDGTIYVGSHDDYLYALNPDGSLKWRYEAGNDVRSSPAIGADGTVYVGSHNDYLWAINPDGTLKWRYEAENDVRSSPAIGSDGTVYVCSVDSILYALNPDGSLKWQYETGWAMYSSPVIDSDGSVYVGSYDNYVYALNPDGTLKWRYETGHDVRSTPAIGSDGTIYVGSRDHYLYALNPDGTLKWRYEAGDIWSSPAIDSNGTVYIGSRDNHLYALASSSAGLQENSHWPKFSHDNLNTGRVKGMSYDVAPVAIVSPPDQIWAGSMHTPQAVVANYGGVQASFDVACGFAQGGNLVYADTVEVADLAAGDTTLVSFAEWTSDREELVYTMAVATLLEDDSDPSNDVITKTVTTKLIDAVVDFDPDRLNFKSKGKWVTCYIELTEGYSAQDIDKSTVAITKIEGDYLSSPLYREGPSSIGDYDEDGIRDLMVKFDRQELISVLQGLGYGDGDVAVLTVDGDLSGGEPFRGADAITIIDKGKKKGNTQSDDLAAVPSEVVLLPNSPNPFRSSTQIRFGLPQETHVSLGIYSVNGQRIATLLEKSLDPGYHHFTWNGLDDDKREVPSGVYLVVLRTEMKTVPRKILFLR